MARQIYGLVGYPVKHSLSPAMQGAAFKDCGIDAEYGLYEVGPEKLDSFLADGPNKFSGLNVTVPHKIKAREYLERNGSLDDGAIKLGAVNTIKVSSDGDMRGFNTDGPGFCRSLVQDLKFDPAGKNIFVLGSGGAAQAIIMYLGDRVNSISVFDLDKIKTEQLRENHSKYFDKALLKIVSDAGSIKGTLDKCDLLVNATPVGMKDSDASPISKELLRPGLCVYDLVYNRPHTQLVMDAKKAGARASTGVGMLLYQGAATFEIWTGRSAPIEVMKLALERSLKDSHGT